MGREISQEEFSEKDSAQFMRRLNDETLLLRQMLEMNSFSQDYGMGGFELEGWLVGENYAPIAKNQEFLHQLNHPLATTELAKFNFELNTAPAQITKSALSEFEQRLWQISQECANAGAQIGAKPIFIGILPSAKQEDFIVENMSEMHRYHAMNSQILKMRHGHSIKINIEGHDSLHTKISSVMMEAATTSFQVHLQCDAQNAHHFYNASLIASAPILAISCNSPFLFQNSLWRETRIPVFEQAVTLGRNCPRRVSFGNGYLDDIFDIFDENCNIHKPIIPVVFDDAPEEFTHIALQNGVIWRWNRPIIGKCSDGKPHIRIEHRILPSGPTIIDMIANAAFFYGLVTYWGNELKNGAVFPNNFQQAQKNFYNCARFGLNGQINFANQNFNVRDFVLQHAIHHARTGLEILAIDARDIEKYLGIIAARANSLQNGAIWQEKMHARLDGDFGKMLEKYYEFQNQNLPIHLWPL